MPINNSDTEQVTLPEGDMEGQEMLVPEPLPAPEPDPEPQTGKWDWVGSPSRPEAKEQSDGISDLFTVDDEDIDAGEGVEELVSVDIERDILDADEDGGLDDLVDVTEEDIMGSVDYGQPPSRNSRRLSKRKRAQTQPPTSSGGMRG